MMNKEELKEAIAVMQAAYDGKEIEYRHKKNDYWDLLESLPNWDWYSNEYRVAIEKPSINWDHVSETFIALAIDQDGDAFLCTAIPNKEKQFWGVDGDYQSAFTFASFKPGNTSWETSLIYRPNLQYYHATEYCPAVVAGG